MFMSATASTRRVPPSHQPWEPWDYQRRAVEFLTQQNSAALFLDPGLGKTAITLAAFAALSSASAVPLRMLVVAPLRVVQTVWQQEAKKWSQFRHLRFSVLHGPHKKERLKDDADVWLINPEGCQWLANEFFGRSLPFDTVVIDELTKFKNPKAVRSKSLRPRLKTVRRRWGLTGTPIPNGYLDLFGQFLMIDDGAALGKYITHYRDSYFQPDFNGFDYVLQPGAAKRIENRIAPYVLRMSAEDYLDLPPLVDDVRYVDLEPAARAAYSQMKKQMLATLPEGVVTGANAAAVYSKLKQMANGAVYMNDSPAQGQNRIVSNLHDTKLDALEELVEELCGQPLLVAYEFNHDLERLLQRFPGTPYIGAGVSGKKTQEIIDDWNAGNTTILLAHPASAGHGLNLQGSGASHIGWLGPIWDLELYEQFIQRVYRQGNKSKRVVNHIFVARSTIDELVMCSLKDKSTTQERLLKNLTTEILRDADSPAGALPAIKESTTMEARKLSRQDGNGAAPAPRVVPNGWGQPAAAQAVEHTGKQRATFGQRRDPGAEIEQRQAIKTTLTARPEPVPVEDDPIPASELAKSAFSDGVRQQLYAPKGEADAMAADVDAVADAKPKRTRVAKQADPAPSEAPAANADTLRRATALDLAIRAAPGGTDPASIVEAAKSFDAFLAGE